MDIEVLNQYPKPQGEMIVTWREPTTGKFMPENAGYNLKVYSEKEQGKDYEKLAIGFAIKKRLMGSKVQRR